LFQICVWVDGEAVSETRYVNAPTLLQGLNIGNQTTTLFLADCGTCNAFEHCTGASSYSARTKTVKLGKVGFVISFHI